jgi:hypothetical protein
LNRKQSFPLIPQQLGVGYYPAGIGPTPGQFLLSSDTTETAPVPASETGLADKPGKLLDFVEVLDRLPLDQDDEQRLEVRRQPIPAVTL